MRTAFQVVEKLLLSAAFYESCGGKPINSKRMHQKPEKSPLPTRQRALPSDFIQITVCY